MMAQIPKNWKKAGCVIRSSKLAFFVLCLFALTYGTYGTLLPAMVTTLEKRFDLSTSEVSWLLAAPEFGFLSTILVAAIYGGRGHHVRCLVGSAVGLGLSGVFMALPYLLFGNRYPPEELLGTSASGSHDNDANSFTITAACDKGASPVASSNILTANDVQSQKGIALGLQLIGGALTGAAASPFWNIGLSLLDDIMGKNAGIYIGILFAIRCIGPIFGFAVASALNLINESLQFRSSSYPGGQKDPFWIGAWWIGFFVVGSTVFLIAPCFAMFDRAAMMRRNTRRERVRDPEEEEMIEEDEDDDDASRIARRNLQGDASRRGEPKFQKQDLLAIFKMYWGNPVFVFLVVGKLLEVVGHIGIFSFFPKFVEFHFRMTASEANSMTAIVLAGSAIVSTAASGCISRRFPMSPRGQNLFNAVFNTIAAVLFPILFLFVCPTVPIMGSDNRSPDFNCLPKNCSCPVTYKPVCVENQNYFSACQAGCANFTATSFTYSNCLCRDATATPGVCGGACHLVYYYAATMFIIRLIAILPAVQKTQLVMALGTKDTKPFGIASLGFVYGICGIVFSPITGKLISSMCLVRNPSASGKSFCVLYDVDKMRQTLHLVSFVPQVFACAFFFLSWYKTPATLRPHHHQKTSRTLF